MAAPVSASYSKPPVLGMISPVLRWDQAPMARAAFGLRTLIRAIIWWHEERKLPDLGQSAALVQPRLHPEEEAILATSLSAPTARSWWFIRITTAAMARTISSSTLTPMDSARAVLALLSRHHP